VVVRLEEEHWLIVAPSDMSAALELGYQAGNMHWRVQFSGERLRIAVETEEGAYLARLGTLLAKKRVRKVDE
jgi:urease accessory protein